MVLCTPLYQQHLQARAKVVNFSGWEMPLHYGSQLAEHHQVRQAVGMFDVSHMGMVDVTGRQATAALRYLLANDVKKLEIGQALYSCLLNDQAGILDDLIAYRLSTQQYRLVWNATRHAHNFNWLQRMTTSFDIQIHQPKDLAIMAVQGPLAFETVIAHYPNAFSSQIEWLKSFHVVAIQEDIWIARTGYTGEDGVELMLPSEQAIDLWQSLVAQGVTPCGLGARDTLRLEAGFHLYGVDMDETLSPREVGLDWTVDCTDYTRHFVGKEAMLTQKKSTLAQRWVGVVMTTAGVLRNQQKILSEQGDFGVITSGGFSPTLGHAIALARVPKTMKPPVFVERRGNKIAVDLVIPPFVRHGKKVFKLCK